MRHPLARRLPEPRGPVSEHLVERLRWQPHALTATPQWASTDPLVDEDLHLALYVAYELHYRGFEGVNAEWEWEPSLLELRRALEEPFLRELRDEARADDLVVEPDAVEEELHSILNAGSGPSLSEHMADRGTIDEFREFAVHRSAYQLKEADPHTWAIPRLGGDAKAALVSIQADEYGNGVPSDVHAERFAQTMDAVGLDSRYGAYVDHIPGVTLATVNLVSMFGLHRRWRGALVGHLAIFEMASVEPMARYSAALRRFGLGPQATDFYDVHVEADEVHQVIAARDLAAGFARQEPALAADVLFGAKAIMGVEDRFARSVLDAWSDNRSSLRRPIPPFTATDAQAAVHASSARR